MGIYKIVQRTWIDDMYMVEVYSDGKLVRTLTRRDNQTRLFSTRNSARKAIARARGNTWH
jgi:hypothetical protein